MSERKLQIEDLQRTNGKGIQNKHWMNDTAQEKKKKNKNKRIILKH